jgi:hypothetical protein
MAKKAKRKTTKQLEAGLTRKRRKASYTDADFLSTGSTMLNLACSDRIDGGFIRGHYYILIGDSDSGKTWLSCTMFAEAAINSNFDKYRFILDDPEYGAMMDMERYFGAAVAERIEQASPEGASNYIEEFYYNITDLIDAGRPFLYVLDSVDALDTIDDEDKFEERKTAHRKGKTQDVSGSYGTSKAKTNSLDIKKVIRGLKKTKSILIIINQTRDNIGFGAQFKPKVRSGGRALEFYAAMRFWTKPVGTLKRKVKGKDRKVGRVTQVKIERNRITGKQREVTLPIYNSLGIDETGSLVDYLILEGQWKTSKDEGKGNVIADEFDLELPKEKLIQHIEDNDLLDDLRDIASEVWNEIEAGCEVERKRRYI